MLGTSDAWSMSRSSHRPSVLYWRLLDFWTDHKKLFDVFVLCTLYSCYCLPSLPSKFRLRLSFFSHDTENTCYAVWLTSEKMWLSIIQICNCWNKKMCLFFFHNFLYFAYSTLKSNPLQILLIFSRDLFLQQCKGASVTSAHLRGKQLTPVLYTVAL